MTTLKWKIAQLGQYLFLGKYWGLKCIFWFILSLNILIFAILVPYGFSYITHHIINSPISGVPISISPAGSINTPFHINSESLYELKFKFILDGHTKEELYKIIGNGSSNGVPIPIHLEIYSLPSEQCILQEDVETKSASYSTNFVERNIKNKIKLIPGDYRLALRINADVAEFSDFQTQIQLGFPYMVWYSYFQGFTIFQVVILFIDVIFAIILFIVKLNRYISCN